MKHEGRLAIAIRLLGLQLYLQGKQWMPPVERIARYFGVSTRTVRRDLEAMEAAGFPLPRRYPEER